MIEVGTGFAATVVSAAGVSAGSEPKREPKKSVPVPVPESTHAEGVSARAKPKRARKKGEGGSGGPLLSLKDLGAIH